MKNDKTSPTLRSLDLPRLVVELPDGKEVQHPLSGGEITIGRDPQNRIAIADNFISKFHAKLILSKTSLVLVDLGSANKTYVNDQPITEVPVRVGDKIRFAAVKCRIEPPESQAPARASAPAPTASAASTPAPPVRASAPPPPKPPPNARAAQKPAPARSPGSSPPPIEADPMKRLLRIGGLLILVSLALAILLRVLLVPSEAPDEADANAETSSQAQTADASGAATSSIPPASTSTRPAGGLAAEKDAEYFFDEGLAHLDTGRLREARESLRQALVLDPDHSRARTRLSLLEEEIEKKVEQHFDSARQAFQFLRYEEAIAEWEMFLLLADESDTRYAEAQQGIQQAQAKLR